MSIYIVQADASIDKTPTIRLQVKNLIDPENEITPRLTKVFAKDGTVTRLVRESDYCFADLELYGNIVNLTADLERIVNGRKMEVRIIPVEVQ